MELFFLILLIVLMAGALGSGYPVAFALPGASIITLVLAGLTGYLITSSDSETGCFKGVFCCGSWGSEWR